MERKLILKLLIFYPIVVCLLLFLPAGSFKFREAWIYSIVILVPMFMTVVYLSIKDPALLERRLRMKEKEEHQKKVTQFFRLPVVLGFLIPGFDYRFNWSDVPTSMVMVANGMVFLSYLWVFFVFRENSYTSRIVEVEKGQRVIATGPYSVVRHPMYLGMSILFLSTPVALGSWWGLIVFGLLPVVLIYRIYHEERLLLKELSGYEEYCQKTPYRLIPFIW
jgi:protein-S-isoprenylcysteine O-methyltransferase Ste14